MAPSSSTRIARDEHARTCLLLRRLVSPIELERFRHTPRSADSILYTLLFYQATRGKRDDAIAKER